MITCRNSQTVGFSKSNVDDLNPSSTSPGPGSPHTQPAGALNWRSELAEPPKTADRPEKPVRPVYTSSKAPALKIIHFLRMKYLADVSLYNF